MTAKCILASAFDAYGSQIIGAPSKITAHTIVPGCASVRLEDDGCFRIHEEGPARASVKGLGWRRKLVGLSNSLRFFGNPVPKLKTSARAVTPSGSADHVVPKLIESTDPLIGRMARSAKVFANAVITLGSYLIGCLFLAVLVVLFINYAASVDWTSVKVALRVGERPELPRTAPLVTPAPAETPKLQGAIAPLEPLVLLPTPLPTQLPALRPIPLPEGLPAVSQRIVPTNTTEPIAASSRRSEPLPKTEDPIDVVLAPAAPSNIAKSPSPVEMRATASPKPSTGAWSAVTFNDGFLVIQTTKGSFQQIRPGQMLPDGESLKSVNESAGEYTTSVGSFLIQPGKSK